MTSVTYDYAACCVKCDATCVDDFLGFVIAWAREHSIGCGTVDFGGYAPVMADRAARRAQARHDLTRRAVA